MILHTTSAQTKLLDSLKAEIHKHPSKDTTRVSLIMDYAVAAVNENTSQLLPYLNEVIEISRDLNYLRGIQSGYMTAQIYYSDRGDFTNAMLYADSAFFYFEKDTSVRAMQSFAFLHNNVGGDYIKLGDYQGAIRHYTIAADLLEKYKPQALPAVFSGMAEVYELLMQPEKAIEYDEKSIAIAEKYGNKSSIVKRYMNYITRHINQKKFDKAEELLQKVEKDVMTLQESFSLVYFYQNKGYVYQNKKQFPAAIAAFKQALSYAENNDDKYQQLSLLSPLTTCLLEANLMQEAKVYLDTFLLRSERYKMKYSQMIAYANMAKWYYSQEDYKKASNYYVKRIDIADSINAGEMKEKIALMETRFKVQGKDNEIKLLLNEKKIQEFRIRQKNVLNYLLIGSAGAILLISVLSYRNYKNRQKLQQQRINELETEKQLMATEAVLKGEEQERTRLAKDLHDGLGGMLSGIKYSLNTMKGNLIMTPENAQAFERSMDMLDSSIKEMRRVAHNMMPEALVKFGLDAALRDFCNDINQSGALKVSYQSIGLADIDIDQTSAITVYRIVQELLNNTMKHSSAGSAIVQVSMTGGLLSVTVEDDGKGFDTTLLRQVKARPDDQVGRGIGWANIQNRVEFLKGKLDVSSQPGKGTSVHIEFNV